MRPDEETRPKVGANRTLEGKLTIELPAFEGSQEEKVLQILDWVRENIEKRRWSNKEIDEKFIRRTVAEIIRDGHTCYMNPCADYTFVTAEILKNNGFSVTLVVEELKRPQKAYTELHLALELLVDGVLRFIEYVTLDEVRFERGAFVDRFGDKYAIGEKRRFDCSKLNPYEHPLKTLFGISSPEELSRVFKHYSFSPHLEQLKRDNTQETYERFLRERQGK